MKEIYFAGGCFWGAQKYFDLIQGVLETDVGYANGKTENPTYEEVCRRDTDHAETVRVAYDEAKIPLGFLLDLFYDAINPTSVNRQGNDVGRQYRSGIYYTDPVDLPVIEDSLDVLRRKLNRPVAIEVQPLRQYFTAEEYHQKYLDKHPGGYCHIGADKFAKAAAAQPVHPPTAQPAVEKVYQSPGKEQLKQQLADMQYDVTQNGATEPPFKNEFWNDHRRGLYVDITTGQPLFVSSDKFDSGCGWPSFSRPIEDAALREVDDFSFGRRTEVRSTGGDAHLGHVFNDGPPALGGLRYCINSAALRFVPVEDMEKEGYGDLVGLVK